MPSRLGRLIGLSLPVFVLIAFAGAPNPASARYKNPVSVFPQPGTPVASESTTFSFRGTKPRHMGPIKVYGSRSGRHGGRRQAHSDGRGVSFIPKRKFVRGETVRVFTRKKIWGARKGDFRVRIGRFYGDDDKRGRPGAPNNFPRLHSRPDLKPPQFKVLKRTKEAYPGRIFFAPKQTGLTILDSYGRINWFQMTGYGGNGQQVQDFKPQRLNGRQVLTYWKGASTSRGFSQIGYFTILNRKYNVIKRFRMGNGFKPDAHELTLTPRGTAIMLGYRGLYWGRNNRKVMDNIIQEVDLKTGAVLFEWHSLGNVSLAASMRKPPTDGTPWDYFHVNAATNDGNSLLVSARHVNSIYRVDRRTGWVRWRLRGDHRKPKANDFRVGNKLRFGYQHDAHRLPNGDISLFNNGSVGRNVMPDVTKESFGMIIRLRGTGRKGNPRRATLVKRFRHEPKPVVSGSQGAFTVLPNGNGFVGWGSNHRISEITPEGKVAFDLVFDSAPKNSYRARKVQWMGIPKRRPAIASQRHKNGATVWASWNGATKIRRWRVLTGPDAKHLRVVETSPWRNLETAIRTGKLGRKVMVQALDGEGKVLDGSKLIEVGKQSR